MLHIVSVSKIVCVGAVKHIIYICITTASWALALQTV